jgi:phosphoglycolate phosphatase-like HAD superfamily hydrolase
MCYRKFLTLLFIISTTNYTHQHPAVIAAHNFVVQENSQKTLPENLFVSDKNVTLEELQKRFKITKPAFFVDFHDTFATKSHFDGWQRFKKKSIPRFIDKAIFGISIICTILNPFIIGNIIKVGLSNKADDQTISEKRRIGENYFFFIKQWFPLLYKQIIQYSTDIYSPNMPFIDLLQRLKEKGHNIYLFSNGGYDTIKAVEEDERFKEYFKGESRLFSDTPKEAENSNSINHEKQDEYLLAKPSPDAFDAALRKHAISCDNVIFIDDSRSKLPDHQNPSIIKKYPNFKAFWACSILYNEKKHTDLETTLNELGI